MPTNPVTTIGLMLTLSSLIGSFFYLQLSQWVRDVLALKQKAELNKLKGDENQRKAIVECRVEFAKLINTQTYVVNVVVIAFVVFMLVLALIMVGMANGDPAQPYLAIALTVFLLLFVGLSGWLLFSGNAAGEQARKLFDFKPGAGGSS